MNLAILNRLVLRAKREKPPAELLSVCGEYYSPYYHFMYLAACEIDRLLLVELGTETGRGLISLALSGRRVLGIDHIKRPEIDEVLFHFPNAWFFKSSSLPVPAFFELATIGLLHIDTEHSEAQAREEFEAYKPYLRSRAVVIFDDLNAMDNAVGKYFESLPYSKIRDDDLHPSCGWGVLLYE